MPLICDLQEVKDVYQEIRDMHLCLPAFCTEDQQTTEAILQGAAAQAAELGRPDLPVVVAFTVNYPPRGQMQLYTATGNPRLGIRAIFDDLDLFMSDESPYRHLRVLTHLDHAFPTLDDDALYNYTDRFSSIMHDASGQPLEENIKLTAAYVEKVGNRVLVEGCVDEIEESGADSQSNITTVDQARQFLEATGAGLIVANLGTEHRATDAQKHYQSQRAQEISQAVGAILVLHGTSCLQDNDLGRLAGDGIIKVNIYTSLAVAGGQAVAAHVIQQLGNIFNANQLRQMQEEGLIGSRFFDEDYVAQTCGGRLTPKLAVAANPPRRDAWVAAVKEKVKSYYDLFGY